MISVVLHIGPGLADYSLHLANALSEVARVGLSIPEDIRDRFGDALSTRVTPLVFHNPRRRELWGFREMVQQSRAIRNFEPDIFHLQADGVWESVLLRLISPIPVINTIHDPIKHIDQRNWFNNFLMADAVHHARGWVVHSDAMKKIFLERFHVDPNQVLIHHHGNLDYYTRFVSGNIPREKFILFFGSLRYNKGGDILLRAFDSVKDELNGWRLVIAGRGNGLKTYQTLMTDLGDRLEYRARLISNEETADLFSRAGIVALPYRHGSQSGVLTIAASFGCPVLATRVGSLPEIIRNGEHAIMIEPNDIEALGKALVSLVNDPDSMSRLGTNLHKLAQAEWNWESIARKTIEFYEQTLNEKIS